MSDICFFGEALIDLYTTDTPAEPAEEVALTANLGGGIFNATVAANRWLQRYGGETKPQIHFLGGVSDDFFGMRFISLFEREGIATQYCYRSDAPSSFALVSLDQQGERSFQFFRKESADVLIPTSHLKAEWFQHFSLVALGTNCMTDSHCAETSARFVRLAQEAHIPIAFDPNIRPALWSEPDQLVPRIQRTLRESSLIKIAEEELAVVFPQEEPADAIRHILKEQRAEVGWRLLFVTRGAAGASLYYPEGSHVECPTPSATAVDTTGAGDAFFGSLCSSLIKRLPELFAKPPLSAAAIIASDEGHTQIEGALKDAVHFATHTTAHRGAIRYSL